MFQLSRRKVLTTVLPGVLFAGIFARRTTAKTTEPDQPHMQEALEALRKAQRELEAASSDKGGFRTKALRSVRDAIVQVEKGINFDRNN
jgi:hypothetical protein